MCHSHAMESQLRAELAAKPSALWQRRPVSPPPSSSSFPPSFFPLPRALSDRCAAGFMLCCLSYQGYALTSSALRGQQLLASARGEQAGKKVFADSLVARHDYEQRPLGTIELSPSARR
jgi:hypothetical protein